VSELEAEGTVRTYTVHPKEVGWCERLELIRGTPRRTP
jgi:hypothetical protein